MSYPIKDAQYHQDAIERKSKEVQRRFDQQLDVEDCALSSWADDTNIRYHKLAIEYIKAGMVADFWALFEGDREVNAKLCQGQYGPFWLLDDSEAELIEKNGKRFIPCKYGESTRAVVNKLGLTEALTPRPIKNYLVANCGFVGGPVSFCAVEDKNYDQT